MGLGTYERLLSTARSAQVAEVPPALHQRFSLPELDPPKSIGFLAMLLVQWVRERTPPAPDSTASLRDVGMQPATLRDGLRRPRGELPLADAARIF